MFIAGAGAVGRVGRPGLSGNGARRPSFDVDFVGSGSIGAGGVFTRASTGTYYDSAGVLRSAAINAPRFDYDPVTLQLKGLLLEDTSANLVFPSTNWAANQTPSGSVDGVTQNIGVSPSGANDAMAFIPGSFSAVHQVFKTFAGANSTAYLHSIFAKAAGYNFIYIELANTGFGAAAQSAVFNLATGTIEQQSAGSAANIQRLPNGWFRCSVTATSGTGGAPYVAAVRAGPTNTVGGQPAVGNSVDGVWLWGAQVEGLPYMSSYIPTTTVAVTRAVDSLRYPVASVTGFNPAAGSLSAEYIVAQSPNPSPFQRDVCFLSDGSFNNRMGLRGQIASSANAQFLSAVSGSATASSALPAISAGAINKLAAGWNGTTAVGALNGGATVSYATVIPTGMTMLAIGTPFPGGGAMLSGWVRRTRYWPRQLSQAELISVTA